MEDIPCERAAPVCCKENAGGGEVVVRCLESRIVESSFMLTAKGSSHFLLFVQKRKKVTVNIGIFVNVVKRFDSSDGKNKSWEKYPEFHQ